MHRLGKFRGKYAVIWRDAGGTKRRSLGLDASPENRRAAETAFQGFLADIRQLEARPGGIVTVGDCLDGYFKAKPGVIPRGPLRTYFGDMLPEHLDPAICKTYADLRLGLGRSPSTVNSELGILRVALLWAVKQNWIDRAPSIDRPPPAMPRDRWLTPEEAQRLLAATKAPHVRLFIQIGLYAAARAGAITGLTWERVSFDLNRIDFNEPGRPRTRKRRAVVRMTRELRAALEEARKGAMTAFVIEYGRERIGSVKNGFAMAAARAGLDGVTPHTLRHTAATWMAQRGVSMFEIAGLLGNSVRMVEQVYSHHHPDYQNRATEALSDALGSAPQVPMNPRTVNEKRKSRKKSAGAARQS